MVTVTDLRDEFTKRGYRATVLYAYDAPEHLSADVVLLYAQPSDRYATRGIYAPRDDSDTWDGDIDSYPASLPVADLVTPSSRHCEPSSSPGRGRKYSTSHR